jgi:hypothetical protein
MPNLSLPEALYLTGVICAFAAFAVTLGGAWLYVQLGERRSAARRQSVQARRVEDAQPAR